MLTVESPTLLSSILGAAQIGDLVAFAGQLGESGEFPIGSVVCRDGNGNFIMATNANVASLYGILLEDKSIADITTATEEEKACSVARHGSFKAEMLSVAVGSSLVNMADRLRELGIYLEGLGAVVQPSFWITTLTPDTISAAAGPATLKVKCNGSFASTDVVNLDGAPLTTTFVDYSTLTAAYAAPTVGRKAVQVKNAAGVGSNPLYLTVNA
jgi:hypothetical protein